MKSEISNSTQIDLFTNTEITRPDVNIGKWAGWLFASPWARDLYKAKTHAWVSKTPTHEIESSIAIRPLLDRKRPTTTTYRLFLALVQIWEHMGKPADGKILFTARQLATVMGLNGFNARISKLIRDHLGVLTGTQITWRSSFTLDGVFEELVSDMSILTDATYYDRKLVKSNDSVQSQHKVTINNILIENMLKGHTKPVNYLSFLSITNDSAANLYVLLDIYLSSKPKWERKSLGLIYDDLQLLGKRYEKRNIRLAKLKEFVGHLNNKKLSNGVLKLTIELTADGSDYKLVAYKVPLSNRSRRPTKLANPKKDIPDIVSLLEHELAMLDNNHRLTSNMLYVLASWYPKNMLLKTLADVKVDYRNKIRTSLTRTYMYLLHVEAHSRNLQWISDCNKTCRYRKGQLGAKR